MFIYSLLFSKTNVQERDLLYGFIYPQCLPGTPGKGTFTLI